MKWREMVCGPEGRMVLVDLPEGKRPRVCIIYDEDGNAHWHEEMMAELDAELKRDTERMREAMNTRQDGWLDRNPNLEPMVPRFDPSGRESDRVSGITDPAARQTASGYQERPAKATFETYGGKVDADLGPARGTEVLTQAQAMAVRMACLKLSSEDSTNTTPVEAILNQARRYADFVISGQVEEIEHLDDAPEESSDG